ncbi:MAG: Gfo/Idh/MocA family oxidoreductase [Tepidisphaeraceae bacterium]
MQHTRRAFLKSTAAGAIALGAAPSILRAADAPPKAGVKHTVALIGSGWWGTNILGAALADGRIKVVGLCDVDPAQLKKCGEAIGNLTSDTPKTYADYRELLDKEKPQIVIVATPDHWHPLITIAAVKAGAHVYVEKPIGHTVLEGTAMVKAARDTGRVVQVGTHRRVSPHNLSARDFLRSGKLGKIGQARCFVYSDGGEEKPQANEEPPAGMDWNMWCGPAPLRPFNKKIHPLGHRQFLDFANGQLGDWGIHWIDQVLWITEKQHPTTVFSTGGRSIKGPAINTPEAQTSDAPDHQVVAYAFDDDFTLTWEHRQFAGGAAEKHEPVGVHFYGTAGTFHLGWQSGWTFYPTDAKQPTVHEDAHFSGERYSDNIPELWRDFIDSIEQNRRPACDIEAGHRATTAALLGMLSLKLGRSIRWDGEKQTILDDPEAVALLMRPYRAPWEYPQA